jgi:hypothetical protein
MAAENRTWGYTRIQGALQNLGHEIGRATIAKVLKEAGVDPAPDRQKRTTWKGFLRTHWEVLAAADFFTVEVWTALGLVRYHVFFVIRLATREGHIAGLIPDANSSPRSNARRLRPRNESSRCAGRTLHNDRRAEGFVETPLLSVLQKSYYLRFHALRITTETFVPPKPKAFTIAVGTACSRAALGT